MKKLTGKFYFRLSAIVFATMFVTFILFTGLLAVIIISTDTSMPDYVAFKGVRVHFLQFILSLGVTSFIIGLVVSLFWIKGFVNPLHELKVSMNEVAKGKFKKMESTYDAIEIGELVESFNKMVEELEKMEHLSESFTANVSHEFKTPLSTIKGYTSLLEMDDCTAEEKKEYIDYINCAVNRLTNLTNNILLLNKISNTEIMNVDKFSLDDQLREAIILLEPKLEQKNILVTINVDNFLIESSKELLMSVWINLLDNAIKFTRENGEIIVTLKKSDKKAIIIVSDNGIGMKEEELEHIFDRFYQADTSHSSDGNGLGLSLVKGIIDKVHGKMTVESIVNEGTKFIIELDEKAY